MSREGVSYIMKRDDSDFGLKNVGRNKRGQLTIFIIIGIIIVVGLLAIFLVDKDPSVRKPSAEDPSGFIEENVEEVIPDILEKGGVLDEPYSVRYQGEDYTYLCYNGDFYGGCYNIHPMLEDIIEEEIVDETSVAVEECFEILREEIENKGFDVSSGTIEYSVDLLPGMIKINLKNKLEIKNSDGSRSFEDFGFEITSPLYELVQVARTIVNNQAQYCYFEHGGYMLLYPRYDIRMWDYKGSKLYSLTDRPSGEEFRFAVRGCVGPPGI